MKEVTILMSDKFKTRFMQDADMFEKFKVVLMPPIKATVIDNFGQTNVEAIKRECKDGPYDLVAIYDKETIFYRNPAVKVISDGNQWGLLDDMLPKKRQA